MYIKRRQLVALLGIKVISYVYRNSQVWPENSGITVIGISIIQIPSRPNEPEGHAILDRCYFLNKYHGKQSFFGRDPLIIAISSARNADTNLI